MWPSPNGSNTADATITVRGKVVDTTTVSAITIDGSPVETSDNFANWQLEVPLSAGTNNLEIVYENAASEAQAPINLTVNRNRALLRPSASAYDSANDRMLTVDRAANQLLSIDLSSGAKSLLSPPTGATENLLNTPRLIALDTNSNRAIVSQLGEPYLLAVDLSTGVQTAIDSPDPSDMDISESVPFMFINEANQTVIGSFETISIKDNQRVSADTEGAIERALGLVYALDPDTGEKTIISAFNAPENEIFLYLFISGTSSPTSDAIYVLDFNEQSGYAIKAINKSNGQIEQVFPELPLTEPEVGDYEMLSPDSIHLDLANNRILIEEDFAIISLDLSSKVGTILSSNSVPEDDPLLLRNPDHLFFDEANNRLIATDSANNSLMAIDTESGLKTVLSNNNVGASPAFVAPAAMSLQPYSNQLFVSDKLAKTVYSIDLNTGLKTVFVETSDPASSYAYPLTNSINWLSGELLIFDNYNQNPSSGIVSSNAPTLYAADIESGTLRGVYGFGSRTLTILDSAFSESENAFYFSAVGSSFLAKLPLNPSSGALEPEVVASLKTSLEFSNTRISGIALDEANNRVLGLDSGLNRVIEVDLNSGDYSTLVPFVNDELNIEIGTAMQLLDDKLYILDASLDGIIQVDLSTGTKQLIANTSSEHSENVSNPKDLAIHPYLGYALILDDSQDAIFAIDLETNERVVVSY